MKKVEVIIIFSNQVWLAGLGISLSLWAEILSMESSGRENG